MIRFASRKDDAQVVALWERCFPDTEGFNPYYFQHIYCPENTLLLLDNGKLCAMTQMLPYSLQTNRGIEKVTYIYGACTAPEERRRGFMAELLEQSFQLDRASSIDASILIPQENWLFGFYAQFGYEPVFGVKQFSIPACSTHMDSLRRLTPDDIPQLNKLYSNQTRGNNLVILRSESQWREQIMLFNTLAAGAFGLFEGEDIIAYAFVWNNEILWAQEMIATSDEIAFRFGGALANALNAARLECTGIGMESMLGVAKFYHEKCDSQEAYMNLMFN